MAVEAQVICVTENMIVKEAVKRKRPNRLVSWCTYHWRAILGETFATILLMVIGCMTCIPIDGLESQPLYAPIGFGLIVLFNIQAFGHISGAHMNPCITIGAVIWRKMPISLATAYLFAQCVGATIGYGALVALSPSDFLSKGICVTQPHLSYSPLQAFGIEALLTAALMAIACSIWDPVNEAKSETNSLKFGLTVVGLSIAGGPLTGASMNPARSLGPALWTNMWSFQWIYWAGPIFGSTIVAIIYKSIWLKREVQESKSCEMTYNGDNIQL